MTNKVLGIIGYPLGHSRSPEVYRSLIADNDEFRNLESSLEFELYPIEPRHFGNEFPKLLRQKNIAALAVTAPYKEKVIPYLSRLSDETSKIGAVNFVVRNEFVILSGSEGSRRNSWTGYNTDWLGFRNGCDFPQPTSPVVLFGTGGAARAVLYALGKLGFKKISVVFRTAIKGTRIKQWFVNLFNYDISILSSESAIEILRACGPQNDSTQKNSVFFINATPIADEPLPIVWEKLDPGMAFDLIYNPEQTPFLKEAISAGFQTQNGWRMLIEQARENLNYLNCLFGGNDYIGFS